MLAYYIWTSHCDNSLSLYRVNEYGSSSSNAPHYDNLGFKDAIYDVVGPHFEVHTQSSHHFEFANVELNQETQTFMISFDKKIKNCIRAVICIVVVAILSFYQTDRAQEENDSADATCILPHPFAHPLSGPK